MWLTHRPSGRGVAQASRSCSTSAAIVSTADWSSPATSTVSPLPAPRVMIISEELASTPLMVTSEPSSAAFSAMIAAGRAWRPTAEPTTTDLLGMVLLGLMVGCYGRVECSDGRDIGVAGARRLEGDDGDRSDDHAGGEGDEVAEDVLHGEQHEDPSVWCTHTDLHRHRQPARDGAAGHDAGNDSQRVGRGEGDGTLGDERQSQQPAGL